MRRVHVGVPRHVDLPGSEAEAEAQKRRDWLRQLAWGVRLPQVSVVFNDGTPLRGLISPQRGIITWSDKTMWGRNGTVRMACYAFVCARMQFPVHSSAHGCTKQLCPILPTDPVALHELVALLHPCRYTGSHTTQMGEARACGAAVPAIGKLAHECADSVAAGRGRR